MVTHVVLFKLKDRSPGNIDKARSVLEGLRGKIPVLKGLEVGVDLLKSGRSYDIALIARFDSLEDLDAYQSHPAHVEAAGYISGVRESAIAVDYEEK